jgi:hypothetical protein
MGQKAPSIDPLYRLRKFVSKGSGQIKFLQSLLKDTLCLSRHISPSLENISEITAYLDCSRLQPQKRFQLMVESQHGIVRPDYYQALRNIVENISKNSLCLRAVFLEQCSLKYSFALHITSSNSHAVISTYKQIVIAICYGNGGSSALVWISSVKLS